MLPPVCNGQCVQYCTSFASYNSNWQNLCSIAHIVYFPCLCKQWIIKASFGRYDVATESVFSCFNMHLIASHIYLIVFSEHELTLYAIARPSVVCPSVTFVRLLRRFKFSAIFLRRWASWPSIDMHRKFYGDRPMGTPLLGELNPRGVAKYSDFGPIEGYISEMVHDRR